MFAAILLCAIELLGVQGNSLRARAFFDANNVKVGDPLVLTIDFIGDADFSSLHPPALAKEVDRGDWKVDDFSAKTDTYRDARRLTYRVRPMREGVLWFPALEFSYQKAESSRSPNGTGSEQAEVAFVRANAIPVHAKAGKGVVVAGMDEVAADGKMPEPPALARDAGVALSDDQGFAWRKVCATPTADGFAAFDFPAARMNEATCAIRDGNWARAMKIYSALEWRVGQTPEIEAGIVASLARRYDNPNVELPVWRQVFRPVLRFAWLGRVGLVVGVFAAFALVFWLLGRGVKALACVAVALCCVGAAPAGDIFEEMREQMQKMRQQMNSFSFGFGEKEQREPTKVKASLRTDRVLLRVGEPFEFVLSLEAPKSATVEINQLGASEKFGLTVTDNASQLTDVASPSNPSNVIHRWSIPVRYDVPFKGKISFTAGGMVTSRETRNGGSFSFSYSNSFLCETPAIALDVKPLDAAGQPADFSGLVSEGLRIHELCDLLTVETNDVVTITYRMYPNGYVPADFLLPDVAFEWSRQQERGGRTTQIEYKRYFVADGAATTPVVEVPYYDPRTKSYKRAKTGGTPLKYKQ